MSDQDLKNIVEALLMSYGAPLSLERMQSVFDPSDCPSKSVLLSLLEQLMAEYADRSIELKSLASGYCFQTRPEYSRWIHALMVEKPIKYSQALLESLAIIAHNQPITRAEIEQIRGVTLSSSILKTLLEREWIRVASYRDVPGKPAVYTTTKQFLDYFNLKSLDELPSLKNPQEVLLEQE